MTKKQRLVLLFVPLVFFALGAVCNTLIKVKYGGEMPVVVTGLRRSLDNGEHVAINHKEPLADHILWHGYLYSPGDFMLDFGVLLGAGCILLWYILWIRRTLNESPSSNKGEVGR